MKKQVSVMYWLLALLLCTSLTSCQFSQAEPTPTAVVIAEPEFTETFTPSPAPTDTSTPAPTATITLTPTSTPQSILVSQTPVFLNKITVDNASKLGLLTTFKPDLFTDVIAFSPDGNYLATSLAKEAFWKEILGSDVIQVWNLSDVTLAHTIQIPGTLSTLSYREGYLKIATCTNGVWYGCLGSEIMQWNPSDQTLVSKAGVKGMVYVFPPVDMPMVLHLSTTSYDNYQLWDLQSGDKKKIYDIIQTTEWDAAMAYSSDGEHYAIGIGTLLKLYTTDSDKPVILEDPGDMNKKRYTAILFSPDGKTLASANGGGIIKLWQVSDGKVLQEFSGHKGSIDTLAFSADGSMLASISADDSLRVWNVSDGTTLFTVSDVCFGKGYKAARCTVAFSPVGNLIATTGWPDKNIKLWGLK